MHKENKGIRRLSDFFASMLGFCTVSIFILMIWLANLFLMPVLFPSEGGGTANAGTAGDMFGGITALFSGLAFAGLISALFMQRKELDLQRTELQQTRDVFTVQRFESTFFGLVQLLNEHIDSIELSASEISNLVPQSPTKGRNALAVYAEDLPSFKKTLTDLTEPWNPQVLGEEERSLSDVVAEYEEMFRRHMEANLAPYF